MYKFIFFLVMASPLPGHYSISGCYDVQEPHPQPPPRKRGGGYHVPHMIRKCYREQDAPIPNCILAKLGCSL